jgi:hypothetical protein
MVRISQDMVTCSRDMVTGSQDRIILHVYSKCLHWTWFLTVSHYHCLVSMVACLGSRLSCLESSIPCLLRRVVCPGYIYHIWKALTLSWGHFNMYWPVIKHVLGAS